MIDFEEYYVSFNDANTNQLYLVDNNGKLCKGFPVSGYSLPKDVSSTNLEFVFKSNENSFSLYKID